MTEKECESSDSLYSEKAVQPESSRKINKSRREGYIYLQRQYRYNADFLQKRARKKGVQWMATFIAKVDNGQRDDQLLNTTSDGTKRLVRSPSEKWLSLRIWYYFFQPFQNETLSKWLLRNIDKISKQGDQKYRSQRRWYLDILQRSNEISQTNMLGCHPRHTTVVRRIRSPKATTTTKRQQD